MLLETQSQEILVNQLEGRIQETNRCSSTKLCGLNDTSFFDLEEPVLEISGTPDILKSPGLIQYKIDSIRIENEKTAIDIRYKPKVNWFADAGFLTSQSMEFLPAFRLQRRNKP